MLRFYIAGSSSPAAPVGGGTLLDLTNVRLVQDGDSYFAGEGTRLLTFSPFSTSGATLANYAVGGQQLSQMLADQASQVFPAFQAGVVNILIFNGYGNSLYYDAAGDNNQAVTDAMNEAKQYVSNARTYCANNTIDLYVIGITLIPRDNTELGATNNALFNQKIQLFNQAILADNAWLDGLVRADLEPMWSTFDSGGYDPDRVHPSTPTGYNRQAELKRDLILTLTTPAT